MSNILEIEETLTEIQELPTYKTPQPVPQRPGFIGKIIAALTSLRQRKRTEPHIACDTPFEMPLDTLARKHPYMYADALLG